MENHPVAISRQLHVYGLMTRTTERVITVSPVVKREESKGSGCSFGERLGVMKLQN